MSRTFDAFDRFDYFAYGSNLLSARLLERTPSARPLGVATLPGHELRWHKAATDGSGKCDVVEVGDRARQVHGVVYRIATSEKPLLDAAETLGVGYGEKRVWVDAAQGRLEAWVYVALKIDPAAVPYDWYHALVVHGAREHGLPAPYVAALAATRCKADDDLERARRHFGLIAPAGR